MICGVLWVAERSWSVMLTLCCFPSPQAHDSPVRAMTWSHNDMWMLTADHGGYVKYWQSNMNNVKMFQAHKEAIREARSIPNLPFSVVNPSLLLLPLCHEGFVSRGRCSVFSLHLCRLQFLSSMIDRCMCVLLRHGTDLFLIFLLLLPSFPVAYELCILIFSIHNCNVQKRLIFTVLLNKVFYIRTLKQYWFTQIGPVVYSNKK